MDLHCDPPWTYVLSGIYKIRTQRKTLIPFSRPSMLAIMGRKTLDAALKMVARSLARRWQLISSHTPSRRPNGIAAPSSNESPSAYVSKLRKRPGKDIWLRAGGELARDSP
jgi:dihydrofolate reductase